MAVAVQDTFARATATHAHTISGEALAVATQALELSKRATIRPRLFVGRCALCGNPCVSRLRYCAGHSWAGGSE